MPDPQSSEQRNEGPGTFINGNVEGGVRNLFFLSSTVSSSSNHRRLESQDSKEKGEDQEGDSPGSALLGAIVLGSMPFGAVGYSIGLMSIKGWSDHPSVLGRIFVGLVGIIGLLLCTACALARLAQIFALWAGRASDSAKANAPRHWRIAAGNARTASSAAWLARTSAALASALAVLFAWFSLGGIVSSRAHEASGEATTWAAGAWVHVRRHASKSC